MSRSGQPTFSSGTPHFFKIILEETLTEEKLHIPNKFGRNYGETLGDTVFVKLPCGAEWQMKLTKHNGKYWLKLGWPEFARQYSLRRGDLLVFRYEGNSKFHAVIFDTTTVEIEYPTIAPKKAVREDDIPPCPRKTRKKPPSQSPRPCKRKKTSPATNSQSDSSRPKAKDDTQPEMKGRILDLTAKGDRVKSTTIKERKSKTLTYMKPLSGKEKIAALEKASGFESKRPFVKVVIQPSHVRKNGLIIPSSFANKYLKSNCNAVILKVSDGRTWPVRYHRYGLRNGCILTRLWSGWPNFAWDNNLKVGDVCVFVLLKAKTISFEVVIFRVRGSLNAPISPGEATKDKLGNSRTNKGETRGTINGDTSVPSSRKHSPAKRINKDKSRPRKTSAKPKPKPKGIQKRRPLTSSEKARILEGVSYKSGKPFFKVVVQPSYAAGGQSCVRLPYNFAKSYIKKEGDIVLSDTHGRSWSAKFALRSLKNGYFAAVICDGWRVFADDNNLEVGDVCIFELVKRAKTSFNVSIVRFSDCNNEHRQRSQAGDDERNEEVRVKIEPY